MWNLGKWYRRTHLKAEIGHRCREQMYGCQGQGRRGVELEDWD